MKILSESIIDYIILNYDIELFNDKNDLENVKELVINKYNYSFDEFLFYPSELSYFKNLEKCTFVNFDITDDIVRNLNNIHLSELALDNCKCDISVNLDIVRLFMELSKVNLNKMNKLEELTVLDGGTIDINDIINNNLKKLVLLNCTVINSGLLKEKKDCNIRLVGCVIDDESIINSSNIVYNPKRYVKKDSGLRDFYVR